MTVRGPALGSLPLVDYVKGLVEIVGGDGYSAASSRPAVSLAFYPTTPGLISNPA
jgi:hypothetical protein